MKRWIVLRMRTYIYLYSYVSANLSVHVPCVYFFFGFCFCMFCNDRAVLNEIILVLSLFTKLYRMSSNVENFLFIIQETHAPGISIYVPISHARSHIHNLYRLFEFLLPPVCLGTHASLGKFELS